MVEKAKNPTKVSITEQDTATLLQRYSATTVLTLLQEVAHSPPQAKIDWNELVAGTSTGISNAREYQMLWRHLAYREALVDEFDNEAAQLLDDDSDLEYELEAFPAVGGEASTEAAACVKVLIASGLSSDSSHLKGAPVEAPNITVPVSVQKQSLPSVTTSAVETDERGDGNGSASNSMGPRKKRKKWSEAEDLELIAAVQKCGEGNWATILRGDFKLDRTASQLSQRWNIIRKKHQDLNPRGNSSGKLSEAQLAARHSLSVALKMPNITANTIGSAGTHAYGKFAAKNTRSSSSVPTAATAAEAEPQSQQGTNPTKPYQMGLFGSTTKFQVTSKKTLPKPNSNNDDMVRAAAVAAGARIASPSDAASLLRAVQAKNAVHTMPRGGSSIQSVLPGGMSTHSEPHSNVHYMRTGLATTPRCTPLPTSVTPSAKHPGSLKAPLQTSQHTPTNDTMSKQTSGVSWSVDAELPLNQEVSTAEGSVIDDSSCVPAGQVQDGLVISTNGQDEQVQEDKVDSPDQKPEIKDLITNAENPVGSLNNERDETENKAVTGVQLEEKQSAKDDGIVCALAGVRGGDPSAVESCENQSMGEKQTDLLSIITEGCNGKQILCKEEAGIKI